MSPVLPILRVDGWTPAFVEARKSKRKGFDRKLRKSQADCPSLSLGVKVIGLGELRVQTNLL